MPNVERVTTETLKRDVTALLAEVQRLRAAHAVAVEKNVALAREVQTLRAKLTTAESALAAAMVRT